MKEKVIVAMSGGVDSSVAAALLQEQGYQVIGIMLQIWSEDKAINKCCSSQAINDAREIAGILNIPFYIRDYQDFFKEKIVNYFIDSSVQGYTPNPCFFCNQKVRFGQLLAEALKLDANYLATGHYVQLQKKMGEFQLFKAKDKSKDQSYMLHRLGQKQLTHSLFPLGSLLKTQVRAIAKKMNFPVFQKKDSQDLCFLGKDGVKGFLQRHAKTQMKVGEVVNTQGEILGKHQGLMAYTIGQRRGLGIAAEKPLFVIRKDYTRNRLIVGYTEKRFKQSFQVEDCHFVSGKAPKETIDVWTKIRYQSQENKSRLFLDGKNLKVEFQEPINDVSAGQGAVFYQKNRLLGGGIISKEV